MFIVVNSFKKEKISINPEHIVSVIACGINQKASSIITTIVEKYYVIETRQEVEDLVNGKIVDLKNTPKVYGKIADSKNTPKIGDNYFYFDLVNEELISDVYLDNDFDKFNIKYGNCFKDRESALAINSNDKSILLKSLIEIRKHGREY